MEKKKEEVKREVGPKSIYLRTLVREDVLDRLTCFAQQYSNGMKKWDYGVAIQVLLDFFDYHKRQLGIVELDAKIDLLMENLVDNTRKDEKEEPPKKYMELLGGYKEEIKNG